MKQPVNKNVDLNTLCRFLLSEFNSDELLLICQELQLDCEVLGISKSQTDSSNVLFLVGTLYQQGRIEDLLATCDQMRGNVSEQIPEPISIKWEAKEALSNPTIEKVNWVLDRPGEPYVIVDPPSHEHDWKPYSRDTSCYCWLFEVVNRGAMDKSQSHPLWRLLEQTKEILQDEPVIAYISNKRTWHEYGLGEIPCIVVAPSSNPLDAIRIEQTESGNCDLGTLEWLKELKHFDEKYSLDLIAVTNQFVEVQFRQAKSDNELQQLKQRLHDTFSTNEIDSNYLALTWEDLSFPIVLTCDD